MITFVYKGDNFQKKLLEEIQKYHDNFDMNRANNDIIEIKTYDNKIREIKLNKKQIDHILKLKPEDEYSIETKQRIFHKGRYEKIYLDFYGDLVEILSEQSSKRNVFNRKKFVSKLSKINF